VPHSCICAWVYPLLSADLALLAMSVTSGEPNSPINAVRYVAMVSTTEPDAERPKFLFGLCNSVTMLPSPS
jgi:hypothetical protein